MARAKEDHQYDNMVHQKELESLGNPIHDLRKKGLNDAADTLLNNYKNCIVGFGKELKKLVRKLM